MMQRRNVAEVERIAMTYLRLAYLQPKRAVPPACSRLTRIGHTPSVHQAVRPRKGTGVQVGMARPRQVREIEPRNAGLRFATAGEERWLDPVRFRLEGGDAAWIAHVSLKEADGGTELLWEADVKRPARGWYNPVHYFMLDEVVAAAERHGLHLQRVSF